MSVRIDRGVTGAPMTPHREPGGRPILAPASGVLATLTAADTGADDDPSSRCQSSHSSSRSNGSAIAAVTARSATALRERLQTGVRFTWSPAARNQAGTTAFRRPTARGGQRQRAPRR